ncbi:RICIN domain-containing protein [Sphaerisporangium sp. NPDC004334]
MLSSTAITIALVTFPPAAHADTTTFNSRINNRMDGSHLALSGDAVAEATRAFTVRSPALQQYRTARWTIIEKANGFYIFKNEVAGKCLQPASGAPVAGDTVVVKTCDDSPLQDWSRRDEVAETNVNTEWGSLRPRTNPALAITLQSYEASTTWDHIYLDLDQNSADRLWHFTLSNAI